MSTRPHDHAVQPRRLVRTCAASAAAALAVLASASIGVGPALAAKSGPFQVSKTKACEKATDCAIGFGRVAPNTRLHIDSVSCWLLGSAGVELKEAGLFAGDKRYDALAPERLTIGLPEGYYALNRKTYFFAEAGEKVTIRTINDAALGLEQLECKIAGTIEKLR